MSLAEQAPPSEPGWDARMVQVGWAHNQAEAELLSGMLLTEGVRSMIKRDISADIPDFLAAAPRALYVSARDAAEAREVLTPAEPAPVHEGPLRPAWVRILAVVLVLFLIVPLIAIIVVLVWNP